MRKRMLIMLIGVTILFGCIFIYKAIMFSLMKKFIQANIPIQTVSTMKVNYSTWKQEISAVGSMRAIRGVQVTAQLPGMITEIYFKPGSIVTINTPLVQQNADPDIALLESLKAQAELARITYERDKAQYKVKAVSKQQVDSDLQNLRSLIAQVAQQSAIVSKLTIRAPFTGRIGINYVNPGQFLNPGDTVSTLQTLDPIFIDFYLPQQALAQIKVGQSVQVTSDTFVNTIFKGTVTTINPAVDPGTRNVQVEATIKNPRLELLPGMFASVTVDTGDPKRYLTLPQSAVSFNPYGSLVFIVREQKKNKEKSILTAVQSFVTTGQMRGDQVAILRGLHEGDIVVASGQTKLKNLSQIQINNSVQPSNNPNPRVPDAY